MFHAIWEFAQSADCIALTEDPQNACQSADCVILIEQTVEPQVLLQQPQIPCCINVFLLQISIIITD